MALPKVSDLRIQYQESLLLRQEFDTERKQIQKFITPGRGMFDANANQPQPFRVTNKFVVNPIAREAASIEVAGIYSWLSSSVRPWFKFSLPVQHPAYGDRFVETVLEQRQKILYQELAASNFYTQRHRAYGELVLFGDSCMFAAEAVNVKGAKLTFDSLTAGEGTISRNGGKVIDTIFRHSFITPRVLKSWFGSEKLPGNIVDQAGRPGTKNTIYHSVIHSVTPDEYMDKPYTSCYFLLKGDTEELLSAAGVPEFPFFGSGWEGMHPYEYSLGPGSYALPEVERLQEIEKSGLMAGHKSVDPPYLFPVKLKGKVKTLPSSKTYVANPKDQAHPLYGGGFDLKANEITINRVEERIQRIFMNDMFLSAVRDPNASPLKAAQVALHEREAMFKIGPVVESICSQDLVPLLRRCYNLLQRQGAFPPAPPEVEEMISSADISIISNLALIQKAIAAAPLQNFLSTVAAMAQFEPAVRHKIDAFKTIDEAADIQGAPESILVSTEMAQQKAQQEAEAAAKAKAEERNALMASQNASTLQSQAAAAKGFSEAGATMQDAGGVSEGFI